MASIIKADTLQSTTSNVFVLNSAGTEYARFNSSGKLGVGTTSPSQNLTVAGGLGFTTALSFTGSGYEIGRDGADFLCFSGGSAGTRFINNSTATEWMRFDAAGLLTLASGQIKFPATQTASSDANTLDDYEEGTWSPTFSGTTIAGTGTFTINSASYTKIGRYVYCQIFISFTSTHTGTGGLKVGGFPFNVAAGYGGGGQVSGYKGGWSGAGPDFCQMEDSTNFGYLRYATATSMADLAPNTTISNGTYFMMAFTYHSAT